MAPLGWRSVPDQNSRTDKLQSLNWIPALCRAIPCKRPPGLKFPTSRFSVNFFFSQKASNLGFLQPSPQSQTIDIGTFLVPISVAFGIHLGIDFLNILWHPEHCYFATTSLPNAHFYFWSLYYWGSNFQSKFNVFSDLVLGYPLFSFFFFRFSQKMTDLGIPLQNPVCAKMASLINKIQQKGETKTSVRLICGATLFSWNHNNYCAVGTWWL